MRRYVDGIVQKTERFMRTDVMYLVRGSSWMTLGRVVAAGSGFILTIVFANTLSQHTYGDYKYILSLSGIFAGLLLTGMSTSVTQAVARGFERALTVGFRIHLKWSVVMVVATLAAATYYAINHNEMMAVALVIIAICIPIIQSATLYSAYWIGKKDFKKDAVYGFFYAIIPPTALLLTLLVSRNALVLAAVYFISLAITSYVLYKMAATHIPHDSTMDPSAISYGKHLSLMNILGTVSYQLDKVLIYHYFGAAELALYTIAIAPPQQIRYLNKMLGTMILPKLSNQSIEVLKETLPRKAWLLFIASVLTVAAYVAAAPFIFSWFFPTYLAAVPYSQGFACIILFFPSILYQQTFTAHMHKKKLYVIQTIVPIVKIGLLFFLLPIYGMWAAIGSILFVEALRLGIVVYFFKKL